MNKTSIKSEITKYITKSMGSKTPRLNSWYVGITNDTNRRKYEHRINVLGLKYWRTFDAETMENANEIESHFSQKGTMNRPSKNGANRYSRFVYVFRKPTSKPTGLNGPFSMDNIINKLFE
jgi:predicted GIY-YIG superfamily endonuclease